MAEKKYQVSKIPPDKESDYFRLRGIDPDLIQDDKNYLEARQTVREEHGGSQRDTASHQITVIEFDHPAEGNRQKIITVAQLDENGNYIPESTVTQRNLPVDND